MRHHVPFCLPFQILSQYHTKMTSLGPGVSLSLQPEDKIGEIWTYLFSFFSYWSKFYIVLRGNNRNISTKKVIGDHFFTTLVFHEKYLFLQILLNKIKLICQVLGMIRLGYNKIVFFLQLIYLSISDRVTLLYLGWFMLG